jgi:DNA modification methylase
VHSERTIDLLDKDTASVAEQIVVPPASPAKARKKAPTRKQLFEGLEADHFGTKGNKPWALLRGDALSTLRRLEPNIVDCAVTSPPYYWQRDYDVEGQLGQEDTVAEYVSSMQRVFSEVRRVVKPSGLLFLNLGDTYYSGKGQPKGGDPKQVWRDVSRAKYRAVDRPGLGMPKKSLIGIPWRVALALQEDGWIIRSAVRWHKPKSLAEPNALDRPWSSSETVFILAKSRDYHFDRAGLQSEEDIWTIVARPTKREYRHAAAFPEALVERCLACGCRRNGIVLDPFAGSGTTLKVALDRGSPAIGIDLNPAYLEIAATRIRSIRTPAR